jgi:hypothetical protein
MNNPATAEVWQRALGKDFGGMAQGDNTKGQKSTNLMFVMTWEDIVHALAAGKFSPTQIPSWTFAPKRRIRTKSASRLAAIQSPSKEMHLCKWPTWIRPRCIGTV